MVAAAKAAMNSYLRPKGFKGSFPHFRNPTGEQIQLITFQFNSSGGSFVVEVADCGPAGITDRYGEVRRPPNKATAHDVFDPRPRIGSNSFPDGDHWFVFGKRNYEQGSDEVLEPAHYESVAAEVVKYLKTHAEQFWGTQLAKRRQGLEPSRY
jgi:hypothetical protein